MARAFRNRDGSFGIEPEYPGDDISSLGACAGAIAQFHLDVAGVQNRLRAIAKNGDGTLKEEVTAEVRAGFALGEAKIWIDRMSRGNRRRDEREV